MVYLILLLFDYLSRGNVGFYFDLNNLLYLLIVLGAISLVIYAKKYEKINKIQFEKVNKFISYAFLGLLMMMAVQSIFPETVPELTSTPLIAAVALGAVTFYMNRDKLGEIEEETRQEEIEERRRDMEFAGKFPWMNRFWGVRRVMRWMYKEGWIYCIIIIFIIINGFFIRHDNLGMLPLQNDEFLTAGAVKSILSGNLEATDFLSGSDAFLSPKFYSRAWPYSLSVTMAVKVLGSEYPYSYYSLRLVSVIIGTFTLLFFYFLLRFYKINKIISLAAVYSFSTFYIFVYYSRVSRMYFLLLFLFYLNLILIYNLFEKIRKSDDSFISNVKKYFIQILMTMLVLIISINIHSNILTIVIPFYLLSFYYFRYNKKIRNIFNIGTILLIIITVLYYFNIYEIVPSFYFNTYNTINSKFLIYQYSYLPGKEISLVLFISLLINILPKYNNINKLVRFSYLIFIPIILFFIFLANGNSFHDPRYIIFSYPIYSFIGIYSIYYLSKILFLNKRIMPFIIFIILFITIFSKIQIAGLCYDSSLTECPISDESRVFSIDRWNYNYDEIFLTIKNNIQQDDILVSRSIYLYYLEKYDIRNEAYSLTNRTKIPISNIKEQNVIFVVFPKLVYRPHEISTNQDIYIYLYKNQKRIKIYESIDQKALIYRIGKSEQ